MRTAKKNNRKNNNFIHATHFVYISLPSLHDYDVKIPNFTFCRRCNTRQRLSFSFPQPRCSLLEFKSRKTNWTRWNKRVKLSEVFAAIAVVVAYIIGSFSIDDGNGSESVSFKMNSRLFNLGRVYSSLLKMASVGEFPWSWFLEDRTQV